jgi:hypothetical protein
LPRKSCAAGREIEHQLRSRHFLFHRIRGFRAGTFPAWFDSQPMDSAIALSLEKAKLTN